MVSELKLKVLSEIFDGRLVDKYLVVKTWRMGDGKEYSFVSEVSITEKDGKSFYNVSEPYSEFGKRVEEILASTRFWLKPEKCLRNPIEYFLGKVEDEVNSDLLKAVKYYLVREILGYGPLTTMMYDLNVEDISCVGVGRHVKVWHKLHGNLGWLTTNLVFDDEELDRTVSKLVYKAGKSVSVMNPMVEGVLPEGYRVNISYKNEVSDFGSSFTIRKFREEPLTIVELIQNGTLDTWTASYLWLMIEFKGFILVMGASGSGKTTLLNALSMLANPNWKIVSIEEVREIFLLHDGWKPLKTRVSEISGRGVDIDLFDLAKFALRERMDYLILGESRGEEARQLFNSAATGHGAITTFHASSMEGLIARLRGEPIKIGESLLNLLDTVVHVILVNRGSGVERKVRYVYENSGEKWRPIVSWKQGKEWIHREDFSRLVEKAGNYGLGEKDVLEELERRRRFLRYLIRIGAFKCDSFMSQLRLFYSGKLDF